MLLGEFKKGFYEYLTIDAGGKRKNYKAMTSEQLRKKIIK